MLATNYKSLARAAIEAFNDRRIDDLEKMLSPDFQQHGPDVPPSRQAFIDFHHSSVKAFPDGYFDLEDVIGEGNKVVLRWTFEGTHTGVWQFRPDTPTGRHVKFSGMDVWRFDDQGRIAEIWFVSDAIGLLRQLGRLSPEIA